MAEPMEIPRERLSAEALEGLIEEFVSREGTDYGAGAAPSFESKVADVRRQLDSGEAVILFDPETGTTNIVLRHDLP
jgi:uncharacterized protein YheU (UPF0270 family)